MVIEPSDGSLFYVPLIAYIIVAALIVATVVTSSFLSRFTSTGLTYGEPIAIFSFRTVRITGF